MLGFHLILKLNKGKGILIIVYYIVSLMAVALLSGILQRNVGGIFSKINYFFVVGVSFMIASGWTYLTKDEYYTDKYGDRKKLDMVHSFAFIEMKTWVKIFFCMSLVFMIMSLIY